jgi:hypothetical protein
VESPGLSLGPDSVVASGRSRERILGLVRGSVVEAVGLGERGFLGVGDAVAAAERRRVTAV